MPTFLPKYERRPPNQPTFRDTRLKNNTLRCRTLKVYVLVHMLCFLFDKTVSLIFKDETHTPASSFFRRFYCHDWLRVRLLNWIRKLSATKKWIWYNTGLPLKCQACSIFVRVISTDFSWLFLLYTRGLLRMGSAAPMKLWYPIYLTGANKQRDFY